MSEKLEGRSNFTDVLLESAEPAGSHSSFDGGAQQPASLGLEKPSREL